MSDITLINDSEQSSLVTNGLAKNGEMYLKKAGSTDAGSIVVYDSGVWKTFANETAASSWAGNTYAVNLDGSNDYINCGGVSDFSFTDGSGTDSAFSISAWVKFDSVNKARIISKDVSTGSREYLFGTNNSSRVNMLIGNGSANLDIQNNTALNTTSWFHIVATYDGSKSASGLKVYVNADASSLSDISVGSYSGMASTSGNLEVGRFANGHSFFNGLIDEVVVWDSELTSSQVTTLYNSGVPSDISSLSPLGWWRMGDDDSGSGTTITDQGSGGNNGTLTNGPTFHDLSTAPDSIYVA
jgi:hypothetical protein